MFWTSQVDEPQDIMDEGTHKRYGNKGEGHRVPEKPHAPSEEQKWESPLEHSSHRLLSATPDTVQEIVNGLMQQTGDPASVAAQFLKMARRGQPPKPVEYAMAYTIEHHANQEGSLRKLLLLEGNMKKFYGDDIAKFGAFLTRYPQAAEALPGWAVHTDRTP